MLLPPAPTLEWSLSSLLSTAPVRDEDDTYRMKSHMQCKCGTSMDVRDMINKYVQHQQKITSTLIENSRSIYTLWDSWDFIFLS